MVGIANDLVEELLVRYLARTALQTDASQADISHSGYCDAGTHNLLDAGRPHW